MSYAGRPTYHSAMGAVTASSSGPTFRRSVKDQVKSGVILYSATLSINCVFAIASINSIDIFNPYICFVISIFIFLYVQIYYDVYIAN